MTPGLKSAGRTLWKAYRRGDSEPGIRSLGPKPSSRARRTISGFPDRMACRRGSTASFGGIGFPSSVTGRRCGFAPWSSQKFTIGRLPEPNPASKQWKSVGGVSGCLMDNSIRWTSRRSPVPHWLRGEVVDLCRPRKVDRAMDSRERERRLEESVPEARCSSPKLPGRISVGCPRKLRQNPSVLHRARLRHLPFLQPRRHFRKLHLPRAQVHRWQSAGPPINRFHPRLGMTSRSSKASERYSRHPQRRCKWVEQRESSLYENDP